RLARARRRPPGGGGLRRPHGTCGAAPASRARGGRLRHRGGAAAALAGVRRGGSPRDPGPRSGGPRCRPPTAAPPTGAPWRPPPAGAGHVDLSGVPVIASAGPGPGVGQVIIWGFDPWRPPLAEWSGRLRLWEEALGSEPAPRVDAEGLAARLAAGTPLDPAVHAQVLGAILLYVALLLGLRRWKPTVAGAAAALLIVLAALGAFPVLAGMVRDRSATLAQVTIIEPGGGAGSARATTVAAV